MNLKVILEYMFHDSKLEGRYLPAALTAGLALTAILAVVCLYRGKRLTIRRTVLFGTLFSSVFYILIVTLLDRLPGSDLRGYSFVWYGSWFTGVAAKAFTIENILLFIPFGLTGALCLPRRKAWLMLPVSLAFSTSIELLQLFLKSGCCELSDVLTNTLGGSLGLGISYLLRKDKSGKIWAADTEET
ncbi:MAG: VanZ family protein [Lachnospiraceae bacterium]|nr:VanZ family protein [Lachnospiraceae bacterium]